MRHRKSHSYSPRRAVVIGGGFSGLATAALLGQQGWDVLLFEKQQELGGRARVFKKKGFRFDMGPSWYLMPEVFERYFSQFGKRPEEFYELVRLNPRYRLYFGDSSSVTLADSMTDNARWFESVEPGAGKKLKSYIVARKKAYEAAARTLIYADIWSWRTWMSWRMITAMIGVLSFRVWESWYAGVARVFKHDKLRKALGFAAVFLGGSPFATPSLYSILCYSDYVGGVWYPRGGMGVVVDALVRLCRGVGVQIKTGVRVNAIDVVDGRVVGVRASGNRYPADVVIGAGDLPSLQTKLLPPVYRTSYTSWDTKTLGISALLLYLGVDKKLKHITHHSVYFSENWEENFHQIEAGTIPDDPSFYISARTVTDPTIAPKKTEELFVLIPLGAATYTSAQLRHLRHAVIEKIERLFETSIADYLVVDEVFTPKDFATEYDAFEGTALGLAHTWKQSLWGRPSNKSTIQGLYFTGQYTNPGVGVPMALVSAELVADMIAKEDDLPNQVFKKGSTTYYYSSIFFGDQVRKDVFALYAYVRIVDDYVDSATPDIQAFENMWKDTKLQWKGGQCENRVVRSFVALCRRRRFEWDWVEGFWEAMRADLIKKEYRSYKELETYMYGSAEVIGFMMARILGLSDKAMHAAGLQGRAMQYINFIRDVKEDEELGRNYLGYTKQQKEDPAQWAAFVSGCITRYESLQKQAERGYTYIPKRHLIPIKTASDMYGWTAREIKKHPQRVWEKKIKPNKMRVIWTIINNALAL